MTTAQEALKPCPFCGHDKPSFERMGTRRQSCVVACGNCGARHESSDEDERSGQSWNTRAASVEQVRPVRDREADRARFIDPAFNRWLDEGISDAGHTVWDAAGDVQSAWSGWESRQFYAAPAPALPPLTDGATAIVPRIATPAMLRPFYECPPDELPLAWDACIAIAAAEARKVRGEG